MEDTFTLGELRLVDDVGSADWIVANVRNFECDVGSLLPITFDAYARVLHPAGRWRDTDAAAGEVSWSQVAAANGRVAHPSMEWIAITGGWQYLYNESQPGIWGRAPSIGSLPLRQARALADVLRHFTAKRSECWFAVWDGRGRPAYPRPVTTVPMPQRPMALFAGPLSAVTTSFSGPLEMAHLWWPEDRSWCVATDIDLMSTYVAGSAECIARVLEDERLESFAVTVDQSVTWDSDTVNPTPPAPPVPIALDPAAAAQARSNKTRLPRRVTAIRTGRGDGPDDRGATILGEVITRAFELADERREMLGTEHLLLVLAEQASTTARDILERHGLTRSAIEGILDEPLSPSAPTSPP